MPNAKPPDGSPPVSLIETAKRLDALGFMPSKSGNVSVRVPGGFRITPSGLPYAVLTDDALVDVALDGAVLAGERRPSSEWRLHAEIYAAFPAAQAIVHTHSPRATALSCARRGLPAFHYMIALAGGDDIRCSAYATFGTQELAKAAAVALVGRRACLLANHGVVAVGSSLAAAETLAREVENLAGEYLDLLAAGLEPVLLTPEEMLAVTAQFGGYGRLA